MRNRENLHVPYGGPSSSHANYDVFARGGVTDSPEASSRGSVSIKDFTKAMLDLQQNPGKKIKVNSVSSKGYEFVCDISFIDNHYSVDIYENGEFSETLTYSTIKDMMYDFKEDTFLHISTASFGKKRKETRQQRKDRFVKSMGGRARLHELRRERRRNHPPRMDYYERNSQFGNHISVSADIRYLLGVH